MVNIRTVRNAFTCSLINNLVDGLKRQRLDSGRPGDIATVLKEGTKNFKPALAGLAQ